MAQAGCTYTQKITDGKTAFELKRYNEAIPLLEKEFPRTSSRVDRGKIAFMLAESYRAQQRPDQASDWYRQAYDFQYGPLALEAFAETLMQNEQYKEALAAYKELGLEIGSRYQYRRQMQAAQRALEFDATTARYQIKEEDLALGGAVYAPSFADADDLLLTSDQLLTSAEEDQFAWTGRGYSDLYLVKLSSGEIEKLEDRINGKFNEGTAAISPDGKHIAFTRCAPMLDAAGYCKLFMSDREGDGWTEPQPLTFQEDEVNYMHPAWSADGSVLYYSSDHPDGFGGFDIYAAERMPAHEWAKPIRMPRTVNTQADEQFPVLKGDTLFFSSSGHAGFGGLDIFSVYPVGSDTWSTPRNLLPPLNSGGDDLGITFSPADPNKGYFSSNRDGNLDKLYSFEMLPPPPPPAPEIDPIDSTLVVKMPRWTLTITVVETVYKDPTNPSSTVLGKRPLEQAELQVEPSDIQKELHYEGDGQWILNLNENQDLRFLAKADGYLNQDASFSTNRMKKVAGDLDQDFELEIELNRIFTGQEIVLDDIYYDLDKADIRPDAEPTLRKLARDLQLNPTVRIRLNSHTDCRGGDAYNRDLSQRRAESAVQFLIKQGIDPSRLEAAGFGEDVPRTDCACSRCSEEEHQLNRRTTFAVLE